MNKQLTEQQVNNLFRCWQRLMDGDPLTDKREDLKKVWDDVTECLGEIIQVLE